MNSLVGLRGFTVVTTVLVLLTLSLPVHAEPPRYEERPYVAPPMTPMRVTFDLLASDSNIRVVIDDVVLEYTEASLTFSSDTYPFQRAVTFCRSLSTWIPAWADKATVMVYPIQGLAFDGSSPVEEALQAFLEQPGSVVDDTPLEGTPAGDLVADKLNNPPHLLPDLPMEGDSTCQYSGHGATAGVVTAKIW